MMRIASNSNMSNENNEYIHNPNSDVRCKINFRFALTNARSVWAKMPSVYDCFEELSLDIMVITETWFYSCAALDKLLKDAEKGEGIKAVNYCRKRNGRSNHGGGVSILYKESKVKISEYKLKRKGHEMVVVKAKLLNNTRPMFIIGVYVSTRLNSKAVKEILSMVNDAIHKIKSENANPYILIAGDFNRSDHLLAVEDFQDFREIEGGPTRGDATLDRILTNFTTSLENTDVRDPLKNDESGTCSDHSVILCEFALKHTHEFSKHTFWT